MTFKLPTMAEVNATRRATPKSQIVPAVVARAEKKKSKERQHAEFRAAVWKRDKSRCRATGKPLKKSGVSASEVGEVHHVLARSTHPDRVYDVSNGLLLSREQHVLAETACPSEPQYRLLTIEGPADRGQPQRFIWRDLAGKVTKTRVS